MAAGSGNKDMGGGLTALGEDLVARSGVPVDIRFLGGKDTRSHGLKFGGYCKHVEIQRIYGSGVFRKHAK